MSNEQEDQNSVQSGRDSNHHNSVHVSGHLLEPTASNLADHKRLEEQKAGILPNHGEHSDISLAHNKHYDNVNSKLYEGTTASEAAKVPKFEHVLEDEDDNLKLEKIVAHIHEIKPDAHLLQTTASVANSTYKKKDPEAITEKEKIELTEARKQSLQTGPKVESKLHETTTVMEHHKYKSKEQLAEEEHARMLEEKAQRANEKKVVAPSPHILEPTAAVERAKYVKEKVEVNPKELGWKNFAGQRDYFGNPVFEAEAPKPEDSPKKVVVETSERLLSPTAALEAARWKSHAEALTPPKVIPKPIDPSTHVLIPTAALKNSGYKKAVVEEDPREKGWNNLTAKRSSDIGLPMRELHSPQKDETSSIASFKVKEVSTHLTKPTKSNIYSKWSAAVQAAEEATKRRRRSMSDALKHKEVSSSLLRTTAVLENSRWVPPEETKNASGKKRTSDFKKELMDRLLKPTAAVNQGKYIKPEIRNRKMPYVSEDGSHGDNVSIQSHKVHGVSNRLLKLTASNEYSKYVKPEEPKEEDYFSKHEHPPVKEVSSRLLKPTANNLKRDSSNPDLTEQISSPGAKSPSNPKRQSNSTPNNVKGSKNGKSNGEANSPVSKEKPKTNSIIDEIVQEIKEVKIENDTAELSVEF